MEAVHPRWSTWTFLLYAGAYTCFGAMVGWLSYFSLTSGKAGYAAWALLVFAVIAVTAEWFRRTGHAITAGLFAFIAVVGFAAFLGALWTWFGWLSYTPSSFGGFHLGRLAAELLWAGATLVALARFRFPLLVLQLVLALWLFVTDLISGGGDWSAAVTLLVGCCYLGAALLLDLGSTRVYGLWLHVAAGLLIGGSIIYLMHHGTVEWLLIAAAAVVYIWLAQLFGRSSWAVLGAVGLLIAASELTFTWTNLHVSFLGPSRGAGGRAWVPPLVFACAGALLVVLGLLVARRRERTAVVV